MIIVDNALKKCHQTGRPIRTALVGAGYMGRGIALQTLKYVQGIELVAIANRTIADAHRAYRQAGIENASEVTDLHQLNASIEKGKYAVTEDALLLCQADKIDAVIEATGTIEQGAQVATKAVENGKHIILMNAELDATIGPILKVRADKAGVVVTNSDGDQPGVILNLFRYVQSIGLRPVLAGNMKGLQDPYRTPATQKAYAEKFKQKPTMVTSFADGTKISMEMAVVANATGFKAGKRGMFGPECDHVREAAGLFPLEQMLETGLVDYILCSEPPGGVFVLGYMEDELQQQYLNYYKMGDGPLYVFYTPYHLCHLEAPLTAARAVLFHDAAVAPIDKPICDVVAVAKRDLQAGEIIDGIGGFTCYGVLENSAISAKEQLLPMGLAGGCRLRKGIFKDQVVTYTDVQLPENRLCDRLKKEQDTYFSLI